MKQRGEIRLAVRGLYDIQKLRIQAGNRLVNHFLCKMGVQPGEEKSGEVKEITERLKAEYKRITDGLLKKRPLKALLGEGLISNHTEYALASQYFSLLEEEERQVRLLKQMLNTQPIWTEFLKDVKGVGPLMAGVLISEIDIAKAKYVSSLWKYAGLDVVRLPDGTTVGRSRRKECLEEQEYVDKNGEVKKKVGITYNPFLKTKLMGVLATSFLRSNSPYREVYDQTKHRLENHIKYRDASPLHRHNYALRKMIKAFLRDLYLRWRELEGLPVHPPYAEAKLGLRHAS